MEKLIQRILQANNINHSRFASDMNISRSYAVALLGGHKPFNDNLLNKLLSIDYFIGYEEEISDEYFKSKHGIKNFELIKYFLSSGRKFSFDPIPHEDFASDFAVPENHCDLEGDQITACAAFFLKTAIESEEILYTNYPFSFSGLDDILYNEYGKTGKRENCLISHIISWSGEMNTDTIDTYWKILKWGNVRVKTYVTSGVEENTILPYYFVIQNRLLLCSRDMNRGIYLSSEGTAEFFISEHKKHIGASGPAIELIHDETELLTGNDFVSIKYINTINTYISPMCTLDYDILFRTTQEMPDNFRDMVIRAYLAYYGYTFKTHKLFVLYTEEVFEEWIKNGNLYVVSDKYLHSFSMEDRIKILNNLIDNGMYLLMKEKTAAFRKGYALNCTDSQILTHFVLTDPGHADYEIFMRIEKAGKREISEFSDALFEYLKLKNHIYTREESDFIIKQLIEIYK